MDLHEIEKLDEQYYMGVFGKRFDVLFTHGQGVHLYDAKGKKYTDFLAGIAVNCLGYADPGFTAALTDQIGKVIHLGNYFYNEKQALLAKLLCETAGYGKVFFTNSGTESNEGAMKLARKYFYDAGEKRNEIITLANSFHGRSMATLTATGQEKFHEPYYPLPEAFTYVPANDTDALKSAVSGKTCAVLMEPIQGEGGIIEITPEFAAAARELCDKHGALLIFDEVQTGMGRTGKFLGSEHLGVKGDIVTMAKAIGNGVPMGAILATDNVASVFKPGDHGSTFAGNFLACAAGLYVVNEILKKNMMESNATLGEYLKARLNDLKDTFPFVKEVRGKGLLLGLELDESVPAKSMQKKLLHTGCLVCTAGRNTLRFLPPYIIEKSHLDFLMEKLEKLFYAL
jgi:acetylornithine/N-succinyldiaminopimelate aminotransferase